MVEKKINIEVKRTTTITLTPDQVSEILRKHFDAPDNAQVTFSCGYDEYLRDVTLAWSVSENSEE